MIKLSDFFQPLIPVNLFLALLLVFFFDIFGSYIKSFFLTDKRTLHDTRILDWLIGFSFFITLWFFVGFFIEPNQTNILISILLFLIISLPKYLINNKYKELIVLPKKNIIPILLLIPFLPSAIVKASLPPYFADEMAYHFISPYALLHQLNTFWNFTSGGLYLNTARLMDEFYILGFSLTRTYSIVRLIQFLILATSLIASYAFIKKVFGFLPAFLFVFIFLSLPQDITFTSTIGYVDVPAYAFLLVAMVLSLVFLFKKKKEYFILSLAFWAMSIGTKYTSLEAFVVFLLATLFIYAFTYKSLKVFADKVLWVKSLTVILIFGGYWYLKNFFIFGNPLYPFFFHCWGKYATECGTSGSFFGTWTTPINLKTFYPIIMELLPTNRIVHISIIISATLVWLSNNKKVKNLLFLLVITFFGELIILKYFSGFVVRYQQHLQLFLILVIALVSAVNFKNRYLKAARALVLLAILGSTSILYFRTVKNTNSLASVTWQEINYSIGKIDIYDWIKSRLPNAYQATFWCENPPGGSVALARLDPDMIWYEDSGFMRSYLINCYYENPDLGEGDIKKIKSVAINRKLNFWTVTINPCVPENQVKSKQELKDSNINIENLQKLLSMRKLNNAVVCNSQEILPNLYHFDYRNLR